MRYTVFPLHPETPDDGLSLNDLFAGRMDVPAMLARLGKVAEELELPFGDRSHTFNSRRAQELGKWAEQQGRGQEFQDAVYRAYFVDGKNIAQTEVLKETATGIGLDAAKAEQVLIEKRFSEAVDVDWNRAHSFGITAVPSMFYGDRRLVGFHPYDAFRKLILD